jgi:hypothetical protein
MIPTLHHQKESTVRTSNHKPDPGSACKGPGLLHEADVGSGERTPAQHETDQMIREIPPRGSQHDAGKAGNQPSGHGDSAKP